MKKMNDYAKGYTTAQTKLLEGIIVCPSVVISKVIQREHYETSHGFHRGIIDAVRLIAKGNK